jgi:rhodanese-related sulfurtransferase
MESTCYILKDETGKRVAIFSGDTLFIGDVGRPDLAQKAANLTQEDLAGLLYESTRKIMTLPDELIVYPAHGAGSACGKNMSKETQDTLGHQKLVNYALRAGMTKEEFVKAVTTGLLPPPSYFPLNVFMNKMGYESIDTVMQRGNRALSAEEFEIVANESQALILDTRSPETFAAGFIPNSINISIDGNFAPWVGTLIADIKQPLLIVADNGREVEVITRLARVGYDHTIGYLKSGFHTWCDSGKEIDHIESVSATELTAIADRESINLLDVRKRSEFLSEHVVGAENVPLDYLNDTMAEIDRNTDYYVHCASGYRSIIFISILRARGYNKLINVTGGIKAIKEKGGLALTDYVCPTTLL